MSRRKPIYMGPALVVATKHVRVTVGHTLVLGTAFAGKTGSDLLRTSERAPGQMGRRPTDGHSGAGDEAWV